MSLPSAELLKSPFFRQLAPDVYVRYSAGTLRLDHPSIILLVAWMNAPMPQIEKCVQHYEYLYPGSIAVVLHSHPSYFWLSEEARVAIIEPAIKVLDDLIDPSTSRLLIHAFSNGGAFQLSTILRRWSKREAGDSFTARTFPARAIIFDSAPGTFTLSEFTNAWSMLVPTPHLRTLAQLFLVLVFYAIHSLVYMSCLFTLSFNIDGPFTRTANDLVDPMLISPTIPRLFLYSTTDKMVSFHGVEAFMRRCHAHGIKVEAERFEGTEHVAHSRGANELRYWERIRGFWEHVATDTEPVQPRMLSRL